MSRQALTLTRQGHRFAEPWWIFDRIHEILSLPDIKILGSGYTCTIKYL